jgi:hypothetical protein
VENDCRATGSGLCDCAETAAVAGRTVRGPQVGDSPDRCARTLRSARAPNALTIRMTP